MTVPVPATAAQLSTTTWRPRWSWLLQVLLLLLLARGATQVQAVTETTTLEPFAEEAVLHEDEPQLWLVFLLVSFALGAIAKVRRRR